MKGAARTPEAGASVEIGGRSRPEPGRRSATMALPPSTAGSVQRAPAPTPTPALPAPAAPADDPFALHLLGTTVQRHGVGVAERPDEVQRVAHQGVADGGSALPHGDAIQRAFGPAHDLTAVTAHIGGAAATASDAIGAAAYATGTHVAFREAPDLRLAAHEAAHVVQQRGGVQLSGGVGADGDVYERHADAVADRVVAGQSAADLLGPATGGVGSSAVQRYRRYAVAEQAADLWPAGLPVRVSDDGMLAVAQAGGYGSHHLWADAGMIDPANHLLQTTGSRYRVEAGPDQLTGRAPTGDQARTLTRVVPSYGPTGEAGDAMTMPDDCGTGAHEVTGAIDDADQKTEMVAVYHHLVTAARTVTQLSQDVPMRMKREILLPFLRAKSDEDVPSFFSFMGVGPDKRNLIDLDRLRQLDAPLREFRLRMERNNVIMATELPELQAEGAALDLLDRHGPEYAIRKPAYDNRAAMLVAEVQQNAAAIKLIAPLQHRNLVAIDDLIVAAYQRLSPEERDDFERAVGINRYADPVPGQAYAISTGGPARNVRRRDGSVQTTYNVHWAGVIMKSGGDTVTMENSAEHVVVPRNHNWIFQMYGAASDAEGKRGQTFHEQNRDTVGAHGTAPTTMTVEPKAP